MSTDAGVDRPFRLPVQWVNRPNLDFRGYCGTVAGGTVRPGDEIVVAGSGQQPAWSREVIGPTAISIGQAGDAVTLTLARRDRHRPRRCPGATRSIGRTVADQFAAHLIWMSEERLLPGRSYLMKIGDPHCRRSR